MPALAVIAAPASAGQACSDGSASTAPDARIKLAGSSFQGGGIYPQFVLETDLPVGGQATFTAKWKNLTAGARTVRVVLDASQSEEWGVRFFLGDANVSRQLKHGDPLVFHGVGAGKATQGLKILVKNRSSSVDGTHQWLRAKFNGGELQECDWVAAFVDPE